MGSNKSHVWPPYLMTMHERWLGAQDNPKYSVAGLIATGYRSIVFNLDHALKPLDIGEQSKTAFDHLSEKVFREFLLRDIWTFNPDFTLGKCAMQDLKEVSDKELAKIKSEFRDLNAVNSSHFVLACARNKTQYMNGVSRILMDISEMQLNLSVQNMQLASEYQRYLGIIIPEVSRIALVSKSVYTQYDNERKAYMELQDLRRMTSGAKILAGVTGAVVPTSETMEYMQKAATQQEASEVSMYAGLAAYFAMYAAGYAVAYLTTTVYSGPPGWIVLAVSGMALVSYYTYDLIQVEGGQYKTAHYLTGGVGATWMHGWNDAKEDKTWTGDWVRGLLITDPAAGPALNAFKMMFNFG